MKIRNKSYGVEPLEGVRPYPNNPRRGNIGAIQQSIDELGFHGCIVVQDSTGYVLAGNHRWEAAKQAGEREIPVIRIECSDEEAKRIVLVDNRTSDLATYDRELLADCLGGLEVGDLDLSGTGYSREDLDNLLSNLGRPTCSKGLCDPDETPEPPKIPVTKPGDLWILGDHRLLCGDSTHLPDVERLMDGKRADLFQTDPPYLVDYDGTNHPHKWSDTADARKSKNKDWSSTYGVTWDDASQGAELYEGFIRAAVAGAITESAAWYCWHASRRQSLLEATWEKFGAFDLLERKTWPHFRRISTNSARLYCWPG